MRIVNLNPDTDIGASAWFVELEGNGLLLDAGVHPKREGRESLPLYDLVKQEAIDAVVITHCHHDHVGSLPVALRYFPKAQVLMSELSYFLIERVLHNSVNVMIRQRDELGIREDPLYSHDELDDIAYLFE
ncbi:MAG: MBL fold metallo-hydrolase, partial [Verrucomicrobiota bacterium]